MKEMIPNDTTKSSNYKLNSEKNNNKGSIPKNKVSMSIEMRLVEFE